MQAELRGVPLAFEQLKPVLDSELHDAVSMGLLAPATGLGLAIGVIDHGRREVLTYGFARPDSIFEIGSVTKTLTGLALAQLVVEGKARLDEPVGALLPPELRGAAAVGEITLVDLATHRSGLPSLPDNLDLKDPENLSTYGSTALGEYIAHHGLAKPRETAFSYSSFGIGLLGFALASRAGVSYPHLIESAITVPLKMSDTAFDLSPDQRRRMMRGHDTHLEATELGAPSSSVFAAAIGAKSTVGDLLTYLDANLHPERYPTLAAALALDHRLEADTGPDSAVALAWLFDRKLGLFEHGGSTPGFTAHTEFMPARDCGIVVLYNRMDELPNQQRFVDRVAENINELMSGEPATRLDTIPESDPALGVLSRGGEQ